MPKRKPAGSHRAEPGPEPEPAWPEAPAYCPEKPRPAYRYVPGRPHPHRHPDGHSYGEEAPPVQFEPARWAECAEYRYGVDLYHEGFFWEAHEAFEGVWNAVQRDRTPAGRAVRALIRLAGAQLKCFADNGRGVLLHSRAADALLAGVEARAASHPHGRFIGLDIAGLRRQVARYYGPTWDCEGERAHTAGTPPRLVLSPGGDGQPDAI